MSLPDMSDVVESFAVNVTLETYVRGSVDGVIVNTLTPDPAPVIRATVQPATFEDLQAVEVDQSLKYVMVHSTTELIVGQYILDGADRYKIITGGDYQRYGFSEVVGEEVKGDIT